MEVAIDTSKVTATSSVRLSMFYNFKGSSNVYLFIKSVDSGEWAELISQFGETMFVGKITDAAKFIMRLDHNKEA